VIKSAPMLALYPVVNRPEMYYNREKLNKSSWRHLGAHLTAETCLAYARRTNDDQLNGTHSRFVRHGPYGS